MKRIITLIALSATAFLTAFANPTSPGAGPIRAAGTDAHETRYEI